MFRLILLVCCVLSAASNAPSDKEMYGALLSRRAKTTEIVEEPELERALVGKGPEHEMHSDMNEIRDMFKRISQDEAVLDSDAKKLQQKLDAMSKQLSKIEQELAGGIINISKEVIQMGSMLSRRLDAIDAFLKSIEGEVDLGILVSEVQASVDRINYRQSLMKKLEHDPGALSPAEKQQLVKAITDINLGSGLDTMILNSVLIGDGTVPGVKPALEVYKEKNYRLNSLSQVYSALFVYQVHGYSQLYWAYLNQQPNISLEHYNLTDTTLFKRLELQWWQFGAPFMWNCHWDDGFICPEVQECHQQSNPGFHNFTCNLATAPLSFSPTTNANTIGAASTDNQLLLQRTSTGICAFGIRNCVGNISAPVPLVTPPPGTPCTAQASVDFSASGLLQYTPTGLVKDYVVLANVSASNATSYALFVNETGEINIMGTFAEGDRRVLWSHPAPPHPSSGPCPTNFTNRLLKTLKRDTVNCSCIHTAKWRVVASGRANITGSWCSRLCQADPQYVAAAPRADGECWCATDAVYQGTIKANRDCYAECLSCPGAPVEPCGINNNVAIYKWEDEQPPAPVQALI